MQDPQNGLHALMLMDNCTVVQLTILNFAECLVMYVKHIFPPLVQVFTMFFGEGLTVGNDYKMLGLVVNYFEIYTGQVFSKLFGYECWRVFIILRTRE